MKIINVLTIATWTLVLGMMAVIATEKPKEVDVQHQINQHRQARGLK